MATAADRKTSLRLKIALAAAAATIGLTGPVHAQSASDPAGLEIVDRDSGQVLPIWRHDGRLFVAGRPGARYSLRLSNHTDGRVLIVASVDGVNIVSGETAGYDQRGYIFGPHDSDDIKGWRKSETEVADFTFAPLPQSYAARTGRPADVGVIGIAFFREKAYVPPPPPEPVTPPTAERDIPRHPSHRPSTHRHHWMPILRPVPPPVMMTIPAPMAPPIAQPAPPPPPPSSEVSEMVVTTEKRAATPAAGAARRDEKLGTAHGALEWSVSPTEAFERATDDPQFVEQIEYDTYDNLVASGVIPRPAEPGRPPRPFPAHPDGAGYVPDPPPER